MSSREHSAGVIVFARDASGVRQYLLLDYGKHWDFPKGHVEKGENVMQAALRELEEETGIDDAELVPDFSHEIQYFFRDRQKRLIHKTVWFALALTGKRQVRLSHEHVGFEFLAYEAAMKRLTYPSAKGILRQAETFPTDGQK